MPIQEILFHIDAEIARLQMARDLLRGGPIRPAKGRARGQARKSAGVPELEQLSQKPVAQPMVTVLKPRRAGGGLRARRISAVAHEGEEKSGALVATVPSGPVAISADEARKASTRRLQPVPASPEPAKPASNGERTLASLIAKLGPLPLPLEQVPATKES